MNSRPSKRRRVSPPVDDEGQGHRMNGSTGKIEKAFLKNAANWSLEEKYESRARKKTKKEENRGGLPIVKAGGVIEHVAAINGADDSASEEGDDDDEDEDNDDDDDKLAHKSKGPARDAAPAVPEAEQIRNAKEELAKIASQLNESPEEHPGAFKALAEISRQAQSVVVKRLCLATQLAVYKDVIPGYRIRALSEEPAVPGERLSSDVRRLRAYEQSLLGGYQGYLKELGRVAKGRDADAKPLADVALACAGTLLTSVPHFNCREDLLRILTGKLSTRRVDQAFVQCRTALETLFRNDDEGRPSMEAVALLCKMMKARDYGVDESVLNTFLHLRLLTEFAGKGSQDRVDRASDAAAAAEAAARMRGKKPKQQKVFRTKRERKQLKEQKALDRDLAQADALVAHEERERMQSETLKLVFATYFRILKLRTPHLMGAVLEGLAKYAHLINQDFFGDLLEALKDLIRQSEGDGGGNEDEDGDEERQDGQEEEEEDDDNDGFSVARNPTREDLLCTVTAYALLAGQDAHGAKGDLHLDLSFFTTHLFRSLLPLAVDPDIERRASSLQQRAAAAAAEAAGELASRPTSTSSAKVNLQTTTVLLVRCLTAVLLPAFQIRAVPPLRLAAFTKQLLSAALHVPEKSSQALLALLHDVAHAHGRKIRALWHTEERKGDGAFQPRSATPEASNPFAATVWEGELLRHHYCPKVRAGVLALERGVEADP